MARPTKPYYWTARKAWYCSIRGVRYKLHTDEDKAKLEFHRLMSLDEPPPPPTSEPLAVEVLDRFLVWCTANKAAGTTEWYKKHIQSFIDSLPNNLIEASKVKPLYVTDWVKPSWSASYRRGAMIAVQRAFKWAVKQGHIDKSPLDNLEKPSAERRDNCPTQAEFDVLLTHATGEFKRLIQFAYHTGARPHELVTMESRHVKGDRIEFMVAESKGKKRKRIVYLNDAAKALIQGREGLLFTNRSGRPWTRFAIDCRFKRIAKKTGKKFAAVDLRHFFCDRMLRAGVNHVTVSHLMGHASPAMVVKYYQHIGGDHEFLLEQLKGVQ